MAQMGAFGFGESPEEPGRATASQVALLQLRSPYPRVRGCSKVYRSRLHFPEGKPGSAHSPGKVSDGGSQPLHLF